MAPRDLPGHHRHFERHDDAGGAQPPRDDAAFPTTFPSEAEWLALPLPPAAGRDGVPSADFVERTLHALAADQQLDADLATLARELPRSVFDAYAVPAPSASFVARTVAAVHDERRARWQQLLARHVAPEPSPQFVATTLAALRADAPAAAGPRRALPPRGNRWLRTLAWPLAAAAAALVWLATGAAPPLPSFEERLARTASPAYAHAYATSPAAFVLASHARTAEPDALFDAGADGVWLALGGTR
jgi:hypothetical protein